MSEAMERGVACAFDGDTFVVTTGVSFTSEEMFQAYSAAWKDPRVAKIRKVLFDNRLTREGTSTEELRRRAAWMREEFSGLDVVVAIVVSDALHFGLGRQAAALFPGIPVGVFRTVEEAQAWLDRETSPEG